MFNAQAMWIYFLLALGGVGVFFLLPRQDRSTKTAGRVLALAALAGLIGLGIARFGTAGHADVYFYIFSAIALSCSVAVITQTRAVYSALYFVVVILAVAGLMVLLGAEFLAAALVLIYAGAILVTYVFVIMLASQTGELLYDRRARAPLGACLAGFVLVASISGAMSDTLAGPQIPQPSASLIADEGSSDIATSAVGNTESIGAILMTRYVVVLELAGVLLLLAMVGAIAIASKKFPSPSDETVEKRLEIGEKGRTAAPF